MQSARGRNHFASSLFFRVICQAMCGFVHCNIGTVQVRAPRPRGVGPGQQTPRRDAVEFSPPRVEFHRMVARDGETAERPDASVRVSG